MRVAAGEEGLITHTCTLKNVYGDYTHSFMLPPTYATLKWKQHTDINTFKQHQVAKDTHIEDKQTHVGLGPCTHTHAQTLQTPEHYTSILTLLPIHNTLV